MTVSRFIATLRSTDLFYRLQFGETMRMRGVCTSTLPILYTILLLITIAIYRLSKYTLHGRGLWADYQSRAGGRVCDAGRNCSLR